MELPQHWVTAEGYSRHLGSGGGMLTVWGWSTQSPTDAARVAEERLVQALERVAREGGLPPGHGYYPRMPLREPVLEEVEAASGAVLGVVTATGWAARCCAPTCSSSRMSMCPGSRTRRLGEGGRGTARALRVTVGRFLAGDPAPGWVASSVACCGATRRPPR
jgi:hypothetical protein